uniref:Neprosin PEP catalytic domain-containing protein n=1 Tax=Leersia perrieri TaxID=77586 RepID=A0A0D9XZ94_9ORYZ
MSMHLKMSNNFVRLCFLIIYIMFVAHQIQGGGFHLTNHDVNMIAVHETYEGSYYGFVCTMDVYGFDFNYGQRTLSSIWIVNTLIENDLEENAIMIGWQVNPELYGDSHTHFFTYWTRDSYQTTGCFDMICPGFVLTQGSKIAPGDVINPVSDVNGARQKITIKVFRDKFTGNWRIYYGFNSAPTAVGYYPSNLFTRLSDKATNILFGGSALATNGTKSPPMGSGLLPSILSDKAATIEDISLVEADGKMTPFDVNTVKKETLSSCYAMTPIFGAQGARCLYGGPGGCRRHLVRQISSHII